QIFLQNLWTQLLRYRFRLRRFCAVRFCSRTGRTLRCWLCSHGVPNFTTSLLLIQASIKAKQPEGGCLHHSSSTYLDGTPGHPRPVVPDNCGLIPCEPRIIYEGRLLSMTKRNIIVVGTSAGGVEALCELNKHLPPDLGASVFVVMHIGSESLLPQVLSRCGNLPAVFAEHEKRYERGCIYCAPANCHLSINDHKTVLRRGPRENGHRPAIDVLFRSAARQHRSKVVGVVLSGGRDDGSAGLFAIKARGGVAIVQGPAEAVTPNMPEDALNTVDVIFCLPIRKIADVLVQLANGKPTNITKSQKGENNREDQATADRPKSEPPGDQIPVACPECDGPLY